MECFLLFADIQIVEGAIRSLLIDFRSNSHMPLSLELSGFLKSRKIFVSGLPKEDAEFVQYLVDNNYGMYCSASEAERFPPLNMEWDNPSSITNAIIEIGAGSVEYVSKIFAELGSNLCEHIELRFDERPDLKFLTSILEKASEESIFGVELVLPFDPEIDVDFLQEMRVKAKVFIYKVTLFNTPENFLPKTEASILGMRYLHGEATCSDCGVIREGHFNVSIPFFTESNGYNSCLNRKVAIDAAGNIKNCPSTANKFGNISDTKLSDVIEDETFVSLWGITKEKVKVCRDCEYRHVCTDCRAYLEDPLDHYSKPLKCGYDPYTGIWEDWAKSPLRKKTHEMYRIQGRSNRAQS